MNKHFYRIIFNKARGMLMVVAEIVKSHQGSSRSSEKAKSTIVDKNTIAALKPVAFMTYIALGLICLSATSYANTIVVDKNADKTQRPIIMPTANGATQVNITAPSGAGVSHNKFTQFDVSEKGVILNNSHKASQTELAGYIKGNDLLLKSGSAKVILNEINSKHASQLNGYIEVAGQKAQVVIANAAGITCNGCGFINANRATLTTGKPILENGELKGYLVEQGNIAINGKGLNSAKQDYTDLIAQTVNINASLWANDVKVVAGRNNVNQDVSQITKLTDNDQAPPQLAIDVAALGGMYAGKIQLVGTQTGVGVHNSGQLGASAGNITITADGKIVNTGSIQAKGDITLTSQQDITNSKQIYSQKNIKITSQKQINNQATIVAQNDITLNANTIVSDSTSTIAAGIDDKGQLTDSGSIYSNAADITLTGQTLATQSINLHADKTVNLNNGKMLSGNLQIIGNDINAKSTTIKTNDSVNIQADNSVNTTSSMMTSHGDITIHAKHIENDNSSWQADNNILLDADVINNRNSDLLSLGNTTQNALALDNSGSKLRAKGDISQTADDIDNQKVIMLSEQSININANNINNKHADLRAQQNISQQALIVLDNQQSKFVAGDNIQLTAKQLNQGEASLTANQLINIHAQNIDNDDATLLSKDLQIVADELSGGGKLSATGDITLTLQNDFNNNGEISANRTLSITSQKTINNNQLFIAKNMSLNSEQLNNNSQAEISADNLELKTNTLINQSLIDGGQVSITTQLLDNKPSGRIYGDNLTISANTLNNLGDGLTAPVIAARNDFKLAVGTLNNYAHGLLLSLGNFTIGQQIDSNNHVIGSAVVINNHSSKIESQGDLLINSQIINNINDNIEVEDVLVDEKYVTEWSFIDSPDVRYRPDEVREYCIGCKKKTNYRVLEVIATGKTMPKYNFYHYNQKTYQTQVVTTDPAKIIGGGNVILNTAKTTNDNSHINAGENLSINGVLENIVIESIQRIVRNGGRDYHYDYFPGKGKHYHDIDYHGYNPLDEISAIDLSLSTIKDHTVVANNVLDDSHRTSISQTNLDKANIDVGSVSTIEPNITLPTNSLYTIHKDTEHHYLIETDSRFTNKKAWLSSDYMFKQLKADPNNIQKRLGDGYYEQQLIQQQIIGLTGQRYLADYANDLAQYQALMNSGVEFANQYGLSIGVALTDAQMNMLTSDIVWMVSKTVTIDGQDIEVLVPQVYIVNRPHVTSAGALVSGKNATIQSDSDIHSSGTIVAKDQLSISANNIHNQGNMIGGKVLIDAQDSIFSYGKIAADAQLMLNAGKDINLITNTHTEERNNYKEHDIKTVLDKVSTVNVKNGDMTIKAGHDINTAGALIVNQDKNSTTLLEAGNDINLSTVKTRDKEEFYISNKDYQRSDIEHVVGSEIYSQGNISLKANNDIKVTASSVNADNALAIQANNININSEASSQLIDVHQEVVTRSTFSKTKSVFDLAIDNNVQTGSSLSGKTIDVNAKNDINVVGSQVIASKDINLTAKNDVSIDSAQETYYQYQKTTTKTSGITSSGMGITIGSQSTSSSLKENETNFSNSSSLIGSAGGNVIISAGNTASVSGSEIVAVRAEGDTSKATGHIDITGQDIQIIPGQDTIDTTTTYSSKSSGVHISVSNPIVDSFRNFKDILHSDDGKVEKGKKLINETAAAGIDILLPTQLPITYGKSSSSSSNITHGEYQNGSSLTASGNIQLHATGNKADSGDILINGGQLGAGESIILDANRNVDVVASTDKQTNNNSSKSSSWSINTGAPTTGSTIRFISGGPNHGTGILPFGSEKSQSKAEKEITAQTSSVLTANDIYVNSKEGQVNVTGSNMTAQNDLMIQAQKGNINVTAGTSNIYDHETGSESKIGELKGDGYSGTAGFSKQSHSKLDNSDTQSNLRSQLNSVKGDVSLQSSNDINLSGTDVNAGKSINLTGKNVQLDTSEDNKLSEYHSKSQQYGVTVSTSGYAVTAAQAIEKAAKSIENGDDARLSAIYGAQAALNTASQATQIAKDGMGTSAVKVTVSVTADNSKQQQKYESQQQLGSTLNALQDVNITADENIQGHGVDIHGKNINLNAGNDITFISAQTNEKQNNTNSGSHYGVGVGFSAGGSQNGFTLELSGSQSKGKENGTLLVNHNSQVHADDALTITSGKDVTLKGAELKGDKVVAEIGGDLTIISVQDVEHYDSKQTTGGVNVSVCVPPFCVGATEVSGNFSQDKMNSDYASVNQQSGIFAGNDGFDIKVEQHTQLDGAVIASQAHDKSKNKLDTGSLGFSNIENKAEFDVNSVSVAGGTSIAGGQVTPTAGNPAFYSHDGDASSITQSAVAEGEIIIRHQDEQQQDITQLSRDTDNANNALDKIFDKEKEQNRQDIVNSLKELAAQVKKLEQDFNQNAGKESTDGKMGNAFSKGIDAATSILTGLITGDIAGGLAGASAPYLAELIKNNAPDEASRLVAHALLGATIAQLQGNSVLSGGSGALLGETAADIIRRGLYNGRNVEELSESEKDNISALAQLASGFAIALSGGNTNDIGTAVAGSKNAVENNFLSNIYGVEKLDDEGKALHKKLEKAGIGGIDELQAQYENCKGDADCRRDIRNEFRKQENAAGEKIVELYESGQLSEKEFNYLVTVYASKMLEGIIEGEKLSDTGLDWIGDIYKASGLSWTFAGKMNNPYLNAIRSNDIIEKSKAQGMSNEQIQEKILEDSVLGSAIAPVDVNGILNLFDNGASKEDIIRFAAVAAFGKATNIPSAGKGNVGAKSNINSSLKLGETKVVNEVSVTRVGRWMSPEELAQMQSTGKVVQGGGGQTFISVNGVNDFKGAAPKGSVYVEFDVPSNSLIQGGNEGWYKMIGPNAQPSQKYQVEKKGGSLTPDVSNIKILEHK
ncbi:hypothetical protein GCM10023211_09370 [Orbus sasakiae]|uniref:Filamentous haemagglutinin FhaB/tRNA nuclease CdiA-like TPS domain-containing protein n=1 Tax=Orbus sasakiae TaxID=1078475 RepID=A0ABP9N4I7_9GAMM